MESLMDGDQGSRSQMVGNLEELRARGQAVIESLSSIQMETLLEIQKRLSALNGRRQRAFRVPSPDTAVRFLVSDFLGTDRPPARSGSILLLPPCGKGRNRARSTSRQRASRPLRGRSKKPVTSIK